VREGAQQLMAARHVLAEDIDAIVERAGRLWDYIRSLKDEGGRIKDDSRGAGL
jgi:hypothetical protein